jgi:V/A-type H+-transporting ATPase subunit K
MTFLILIPIAFLIGSILIAFKALKGKEKFRKALAMQITAFIAICFICLAVPMMSANAAPADDSTTATTTSATDSAKGMGLIAAGICTGLAGIGGGIAVGGAASSAIGATSEDPKNFGKSLIFVALGEGIAIYGLLISILILARV